MQVSLIISTYNRSHLLIPLLRELERQTFPDYEVVVADDGSIDGTQVAVEQLATEVSYSLRIVSHMHQGYRLAKSRNNGAKTAQGRQLVFMDDDCLPTPTFLESYSYAFQERVLLRGDILFVPSFDQVDDVLYKHRGKGELWGANLSVGRDLFMEIGGYDEDFENQAGEDTDLQKRIGRLGCKEVYVPDAYVYHLGMPHSGGMPNDLWRNVKMIDKSIKRNTGGPL